MENYWILKMLMGRHNGTTATGISWLRRKIPWPFSREKGHGISDKGLQIYVGDRHHCATQVVHRKSQSPLLVYLRRRPSPTRIW